MHVRILAVAGSLALFGCASTNLSPGLNSSATKATDAASVAHSVEAEVLEARVLDMVDKESLAPSPSVPPALVCKPSPSVELTAKELGTYADAINTVGKVAEKPKDVSYAGYLQQFRKNQTAIEASQSSDDASEKDQKETLEAQARCMTLLASDLDKRLLAPAPQVNGFVVSALPAAVASVDGMIKALLGLAEQVQRDVAVRKSAAHMIAVLKDATAKLSEPPGDGDYTLPGEATSRLGNTFAIHRWFAARRLQADWHALRRAKDEKNEQASWEAADKFVAHANDYVKLSANDPDKLLKELQKAVDDAGKIDDKTSLGEIFDSLSDLGAALSNVDDKYKSFRKTVD